MNRRLGLIVGAVCGFSLLVGCSSAEQSSDDTSQVQEVDLTRAPVDTTWVTGPAGLKYPVSKEAGPFELSFVPHNFASSAQGAVVAAMTGQVFMAGADDQSWPEVSQVLLEPGQGRDQWAQARALMSVEGTLLNPPVFEGFKFSSFDGSNAVVTLAVRYPAGGGVLAAMPVQLSRASGDWKVVLPPQDKAPDLVEITQDQFGDFVPFSPEGV